MKLTHSIRLITILCTGAGAAIPAIADEQPSRAPGGPPAAVAGAEKIDLNTADVNTLASVPVIGPEVAKAIVAARPFATVDELDRVKGLTAEQLEQIRSKVAVSATHAPTKLGMPTVTTGTAPARKARSATASPGARKKVDVNTADLKTLESVPSIGPDAARAIIAARPFATLDELSRVKGLSAEQMELIRADLSVESAPRR
jgi:DNA uptake protein ComE-like DNA-binding protein